MDKENSKLAFSAPRSVLVDGRKLGHGGIGVYIENLIAGLVSQNTRVAILSRPDLNRSKYDWFKDVEWIEERAALYSIDELFFLSRRIDFSRFDLFHSPHYTLPFGIPIPSVVTIHDLIHITHPQRFFYPIIAKSLIRSSLNRASQIIAVSEATKQRLFEIFPRSRSFEAKIHVIPNALPKMVRGLERTTGDSGSAPYLLMNISTDKPHKGLADSFAAFAIAQGELERDRVAVPELVVVGQGVRDLPADKIPKNVHLRGSVSEQELLSWYRGALALLVPSLEEGFCLPALEAQALGTRVISRPIAALKEILSSDDVIATDLSVKALARAIESGIRLGKREGAVVSLDRYRLSVVTAQLLEVYRLAV